MTAPKEIVSIDPSGIGSPSQGTGCADDAFVFGLCDASGPCTGPDDALAAASIGDSGAQTVIGPAFALAPLSLVILGKDGCDTSAGVPYGGGAHLTLTYIDHTDTERTRKIALPTKTLDDEPVPVPLLAVARVSRRVDVGRLGGPGRHRGTGGVREPRALRGRYRGEAGRIQEDILPSEPKADGGCGFDDRPPARSATLRVR